MHFLRLLFHGTPPSGKTHYVPPGGVIAKRERLRVIGLTKVRQTSHVQYPRPMWNVAFGKGTNFMPNGPSFGVGSLAACAPTTDVPAARHQPHIMISRKHECAPLGT
jgi:hypothetical protein